MPEHQGSTGKINAVKLESTIDRVLWTSGTGSLGSKVGLEVNTHFVGNNSDIKIEISDKSGKVLDTIKSKISGNFFWTQVTVPDNAKDELYAQVSISKLGLSKKSNRLYLYPPIQIKNLKWDKKEARRGDVLKLTADLINVYNDAEAEMQIWEYDSDGSHDLITKFPVIVKNQKIETEWAFEYHEDTDDIPTNEESEKGYNPPEYFFRVVIAGESGDSGILNFKDFIEIKLVDQEGNLVKKAKYKLTLPNGNIKEGNLDDQGYAKIDDVPPGKFEIAFPDIKGNVQK